ncbi:MAG: hypothetical protein IPK80_05705 [Nannocystis sp.]|nr:hypothetical protein [Nannocystis sp.]
MISTSKHNRPRTATKLTCAALLACMTAGLPACSGDDGASATDTTTDATTTGATDTTDTESTGETPLQPADLVGRWVSAGCESYPDGMGGTNYLTRDFTLTATTWNLKGVIFADPECSTPFFDFEIDGPYTLGALSQTVLTATEGDFGFTTNVWTARLQGAADLFDSSGCGAGSWQVDVPQDVTQTGCIGVAKPIGECPEEYDIVAVVGDDLFFGERITDMCAVAGRPAALNTYPVVRD